jgi:flagellar basal-body rod protein FlgB
MASELEAMIAADDTTPVNQNGNNVDIDKQNVEMVRTQIQYQFVTRLMTDEMSREKYAINGGRG